VLLRSSEGLLRFWPLDQEKVIGRQVGSRLGLGRTGGGGEESLLEVMEHKMEE